MSRSRTQKVKDGKRRIAYRLRERHGEEQARPMFTASNIHYDVARKDRGLGEGGIGALHLLAGRVGLIERIDRELHVLKRHLPYHESDHVLNIASTTFFAAGRAWRTWSCAATTRCTWTPWAPTGSRIPPRKATSAVASPPPTWRR